MDEIFNAIAAKTDDTGRVDIDEIEVFHWATQRNQTAVNFLDSFGLELAKRYHKGELSFTYCDDVMNDLWGILVCWSEQMAEPWPKIFYEVYDTFDAGESHLKEDGSDDAASEFIKPFIADILRRNR